MVLIQNIEVDIITRYSLSSAKNIINSKIWPLSLLKNSKNQNLNKCTFKGKMEVSMLKNSSCVYKYYTYHSLYEIFMQQTLSFLIPY